MFDQLVAEVRSAGGAAAVGGWARVEAAACARRLQAMVAVLDACQAADGSAEREQWYLDNWGAVCAEIGAAEQITSAAASNQLLVATMLRDRLPQVAAVFAEGCGSYRLMSTIVWRTALIKDPVALGAVDLALASALRCWEPMSEAKTVAAIDHWVGEVDPHALRRSQSQARSRCVEITVDDAEGLATLWGSLFAHDAKTLDGRLDAIAATVCEADPRTRDQRRADALGAVANGAQRLSCLCSGKHCAAGAAEMPLSSTVVYVIAHQGTLTEDTAAAAAQDTALDGEQPPHPSGKALRDMTLAEALQHPVPPGFAATLARGDDRWAGAGGAGAAPRGTARGAAQGLSSRGCATAAAVPAVAAVGRLRALPGFDVSLPGL
jgi:hypothetical protein